MRLPAGSATVKRVEERIRSFLPQRGRVALAYSGGLSSTLLAMLVRKRCELECFAAGVKGSPDVLAAIAARDHLDYRVEIIELDVATTLRIARDLRTSYPSLSSRAIHALVPLAVVRERTQKRMLLTGFGTRRLDATFGSLLTGWKIESPLSEIFSRSTPGRASLQAAALSLGLPIEWTQTAHRAPAKGAGIDRFLRTIGPSGNRNTPASKFH